MGTYYIRQKVMTVGDEFNVLDDKKDIKYKVKSNLIGKKKLTVTLDKKEVAQVKEKEFLGAISYDIIVGGKKVANLKAKKNEKKPEFHVSGMGWNIKGGVWENTFKIHKFLETIATIKKEKFSMGDSYRIEVGKDDNDLAAIAVVLAIDAILYDE
ncbi:MAG: hypothetical protein K6B14_04790 [Lachnospiraceae bacterium]|nr:hypothetical protein [Lachnospiraceae bacterium]